MSIIGWILLGLISGFIASKIVNKTGEGFFLDSREAAALAVPGSYLRQREKLMLDDAGPRFWPSSRASPL